MDWQVEYWHGRRPLEVVTSADMPWTDLPADGVIFVTVTEGDYGHRLQGMDRYWLDGDEFGCFIVDHDQCPEGLQASSYRADVDGFVDTGGRLPDPHVHAISGVWMPDDQARDMGL